MVKGLIMSATSCTALLAGYVGYTSYSVGHVQFGIPVNGRYIFHT